MLTVELAAIQFPDGRVFSVSRPGRHNAVFAKLKELNIIPPKDHIQGFILSDGTFVDRAVAYGVAISAEQIHSDKPRLEELFTEDLW